MRYFSKRALCSLFLSLIVSGLLFLTPLSASAESLKLTLDSAIELALDRNLSVKVAESEIERVDWAKKENWYKLLPQIGSNIQYVNNILKPVFFSDFFPGGKMEVGSTHSYGVTGSAQLPLLSFPLLKSIQLSELELLTALESARGAKIELVAEVKNSFYGALMVQESLRVLLESYENAKEVANNIAQMYKNGLASEYDFLRSDVAVRNILPAIEQAKNGVELSLMQLKVLLSLGLETDIELDGTIEHYYNALSGDLPQESVSLAANSTLRTLDLQLESLNKSFELIRSQRLPSIAGFANYQLQAQSEEFTLDNNWVNSFAVGLTIQIPIFNQFTIAMKEKQTKVGVRQVQFQRELLESNLQIAVRNWRNEMSRAKLQLESDAMAVKQAEKGYEIAKSRYNSGAGTLLELNDAQMALTNSQLNINQTIYSFIKAESEYHKLVGVER